MEIFADYNGIVQYVVLKFADYVDNEVFYNPKLKKIIKKS